MSPVLIQIEPMGAPRMTRADSWKRRGGGL